MTKLNHLRLSGQKVLVTGASAGIGLEFAKQLHQEGATIIACARREARLAELCNELNKTRNDSASYVVCDLTSSKGIEELVTLIKETEVDVLVNNAGRGSFGRFEELRLEEELELVNLNINCIIQLSHAVVPQMKARRSGIIINLASIAAIQPLPYMATYAATKAFDLSFSISLAHELKPFGIRVLAVMPGPVATEFGQVAKVPNEFNELSPVSSQLVVKSALNTLFNTSRSSMIPGFKARLMSVPAKLLPLSITVKLTERVLRKHLKS